MRTVAILIMCALAGGTAWGETRAKTKSKTTSKTKTNRSTTVKKEVKPAPVIEGWEPIGIAECDLYLGRLHMCMQSPKFPAEARDAVKQALIQARDGWKDIVKQPEAARAANDACRQANDAMAQGADAMCPGVWPPAKPQQPPPAPAPTPAKSP